MHVPATQSLAIAIGAGSLVSLLCSRLRIPPILFLLMTGIALGRSGLHIVGTYQLGDALGAFVTVAVGILVFEGGLHLNRRELQGSMRAVIGLLSIGALVTWTLATGTAHWIAGLGWPVAALLGAALIVTGPTVVQPLLRRFHLAPNLHTTLWAEAILIDPIAILAAVVALDVAVAGADGGVDAGWGRAAWVAFKPLFTGLAIGAAVGLSMREVLARSTRRDRLDARQLSLFAMAAAMLSVGLGESAAPQGGLVAVTICGILMANTRVLGVEDMHQFKEQVSAVLVGGLFVLLGSRVELWTFREFTWLDGACVAIIILVVRPATVMLSTLGSELTMPERLFAAFLAPRGVVAASTLSLAVARFTTMQEDPPGPDDTAQMAENLSRLIRDARHAEMIMLVLIFTTMTVAATIGARVDGALGVGAKATLGPK